MSNGLVEYFGDLPDPRVRGRTDYPLIEILFLCISAIVSGFDGWEAIEDFRHGKLNGLKKFLPYENGIPRHEGIGVLKALFPNFRKYCDQKIAKKSLNQPRLPAFYRHPTRVCEKSTRSTG